MREKTRKIFIMIVMAALIVSLMAASFAALTYGRYTGGKLDDDSPYDEIIDFVGETAFEVSTADELVNAINNGYSYIKVVGDDPTLVVNNNVADVVVNLVLDVNGHKIVRNSRNPLLNVRQSVSVVLVYDSSTDADGGFYNPVGSALQTSGGTLTVGEGVYESGPRDKTPSSVSKTVSATVCSRTERTAKSYSVRETDQTFPKLAKDTGDVYLTAQDPSNIHLEADTYLIYTEEKNAFVRKAGDTVGGTVLQEEQLYVNAKETSSGETTTITADKFSPICDVASCDFYYYYPVGVAGTAKSPQTYAVVYGYNDVKGLAKAEDTNLTSGKDTNLVWPYAAIRSEAGTTHARGGEFYTYFGEENTYSIYSEGGTMTVGLSGESDPPKFQAIGKGVCINMAGTSGNADQTLTIDNGEFSSQLGNTIEMSGGEMEVKKGSFTKDATVLGAASGDGASNGSAISISGGTLNMTGTEANPVSFDIKGDYVNGIRVQATTAAATATIANATFDFNDGAGSTNVAGVRSFGGDLTVNNTEFNISTGATSGSISKAAGLSAESGTVTATDCEFNFAQYAGNVSPTESAGISSFGGTVTATDCAFTIPGNKNYGIYSSITEEGAGEGEYDTTATGCTFTMTGNQNHGIYAAGGKTLASGGTYTIGSENGSGQTANFGIQVSSGSVALAGVTLDVYGEKSSCVYAVGGTISLSGGNAVNMHFSSTGTTISSTAISTEGGAIEVTGGSTSVSSDALGITARQNDGKEGSISIANGAAVTVGSKESPLQVTGVYVNGGKIENKGTLTVFSTIKDRFSWNENNKYNGVYVNGGSLVSEGTLNVTFTGVQNDAQQSSGDVNTNYSNQQTKSYAVRVEGDDSTNVTIASGNINNQVGGGVYVGGGKVYLGATVTLDDSENVTATKADNPVSVSTTGTSMGTTTSLVGLEGMDKGTWQYRWNLTGGDAVKVVGGKLFVYGGTYQAALGNGILVSNGNAAIENGTFSGGGTLATTGAAATYAFKSYGGSVTIYDGNFTSASGGAFVMGTSVDTDDDQNIKIYGGKFDASAATAISAWNNATILFDPYCPLEGYDTDRILNVHGESTGLAIEVVTGGSQKITINGGDFKGDNRKNNNSNTNGIWYGNGSATLKITGGTFTGATNAGLDIEGNPGRIDRDSEYQVWPPARLYTFTDNRHILISGGTFTGGDGSIKSDERDLRVCDILYSELVDDLENRESDSYSDVIIDTSIVTVNGTNYNSESTTEIRNSLASRTTITVSR